MRADGFFEREHAKEYGIVAAVLINHITWIIEDHMNERRNAKDGRTWCEQSWEGLTTKLNWVTPRTIKDTLQQLVKDGVIEKRNTRKGFSGDYRMRICFKDEQQFLGRTTDSLVHSELNPVSMEDHTEQIFPSIVDKICPLSLPKKERREKENTEDYARASARGASAPSSPSQAVPKRESKTRKPASQEGTAGTHIWLAYSEAFAQRYGHRPVSNADTRRHCKTIADSLPLDEAQKIARFYVTLNNAWYITKGHDIVWLKQDFNKIRVEMLSGNRITASYAQKADKHEEQMSIAERVIEKRRLQRERGEIE